MKERTESLKLVNAALKPLPSKKFFEGAVPLTPREEVGDNPGQGKTGSLHPRNDLLGPRACSTHVGRDLPVCVPMFANYQSIVKSTLFQGGVRVVLQLEGSITGRLRGSIPRGIVTVCAQPLLSWLVVSYNHGY